MIASAQEVEFGLPEQIEENDQYTVAGFLVTISQARRALGCPARDEGLQLVEEGLYDDYYADEAKAMALYRARWRASPRSS